MYGVRIENMFESDTLKGKLYYRNSVSLETIVLSLVKVIEFFPISGHLRTVLNNSGKIFEK